MGSYGRSTSSQRVLQNAIGTIGAAGGGTGTPVEGGATSGPRPPVLSPPTSPSFPEGRRMCAAPLSTCATSPGLSADPAPRRRRLRADPSARRGERGRGLRTIFSPSSHPLRFLLAEPRIRREKERKRDSPSTVSSKRIEIPFSRLHPGRNRRRKDTNS